MGQKLYLFLACFLLKSYTGFATLTEDHLDPAPIEVETNEDDTDPLRPFNEAMFAFNEVFDGLVLGPVAQLYDLLMPDTFKENIHNVLSNAATPYILMNDILQGDGPRAHDSLRRFLINSTFGLGGLFDVAYKDFDISHHSGDFGQTLAVWGAGEGFYLVLPILGPSTFRDTVGLGADFFLDPVNYMLRREVGKGAVYARSIAAGIDRRQRGIGVMNYIYNSPNPYDRMKALYLQNREYEIKKGNVDHDSPTPDDMDD